MINYHLNDLVMAVKNDPIMIENWLDDQRKTDYIMLHLDDFKKFKEPNHKIRSHSVETITRLPKRYKIEQEKFWNKVQHSENFNKSIIQNCLEVLKEPNQIENKVLKRYRNWSQRVGSKYLTKEKVRKDDLPLRNLKIGHILQRRNHKLNENSSLKQEQLLYLENRMKDLRNTLQGTIEDKSSRQSIGMQQEFKQKLDFNKSFLNMPKYLEDNYNFPKINYNISSDVFSRYLDFRKKLIQKIKE